jgi:hypothetical protein
MNTYNLAKGRTICCYCQQPRNFSADLHGCPESLQAQAYLAGVIGDITAIGTGQPRTSEPWDLGRAGRKSDIAQRIKITGGGVKPRN